MLHIRIPIGLALVATTVIVAGCGGGGKGSPGAGSPSSSASGKPPAGIAAAAYKYSRCMRTHGVTSFPDPRVQASAGHVQVAVMVTPAITGSPQFKTAQHACAGILPAPGNSNGNTDQSAAHRAGLLSFANCMRSHRVSTFPDPNNQGQITPTMLTAAGLNLHAPAVDAAATACIPASHGVLNAAAVNQAINGGS